MASLVWSRLGNVPNYVEPFFGSGAVLLGRPNQPKIETVNDIDCYLTNFWRALQNDPESVTRYSDLPVNEADLHARHNWLIQQDEFRERMKSAPDYFDAKIAGWWVWGISSWTGREWCRVPALPQPPPPDGRRTIQKVPPRQLPHLSDGGMGINRMSIRGELDSYFNSLASRLRCVRVCCGDWRRVLGKSVTTKLGVTGIFLDPPYGEDARRDGHLYACEDLGVARDVRDWAAAHGDDPKLRIALSGYEGERAIAGWECVSWKSAGGYGSQSNGQARDNSRRERIWFSPHCLRPEDPEYTEYAEDIIQAVIPDDNQSANSLYPACSSSGAAHPLMASREAYEHGGMWN